MELHILFFILAGLLVAILVGVSLWSARREKSRIFSNTFSNRPPSTPIDNSVLNVPASLNLNHRVDELNNTGAMAESSAQIQQEVESSLREIKIHLPKQENNAHSQPSAAPIYNHQPAFVNNTPAPQPVIEPAPKATSVLEVSVEELQRQAAQGGEVDFYSNEVRAELARNSMRNVEPASASMIEPVVEPQSEPVVQNNMITLYVVAPEGQQFQGDDVAQSLEALGFQFGEYQIFHRHQHLGDSNSPVIFSAANMMQPGIFDLAKISHFSTVGLVLFMHLPSGNDAVNLRLLIKTTQNLAESLGGFVLNENRELFDELSYQAYLARVS